LLELHLITVLAEAAHSRLGAAHTAAHGTAHAAHGTSHTAALVHTSGHWIVIETLSKGVWLEALLLLLLLLLLHASKWLLSCLAEATSGTHSRLLLLSHHVIALHSSK